MTDNIPPPRSSPRPDVERPSELDEEPKTNPAIRKSNLRTRIFALIVSGGFSGLGLGGVAYAYDKLRTDAADAGAAAAQKVVGDVDATKRKVDVVDADLQQHKAAEAQERLEIKQDLHARGEEIRDLYKAVMEGKRSDRLERPLPPLDGGIR